MFKSIIYWKSNFLFYWRSYYPLTAVEIRRNTCKPFRLDLNITSVQSVRLTGRTRISPVLKRRWYSYTGTVHIPTSGHLNTEPPILENVYARGVGDRLHLSTMVTYDRDQVTRRKSSSIIVWLILTSKYCLVEFSRYICQFIQLHSVSPYVII